jgi:hypothetical protein
MNLKQTPDDREKAISFEPTYLLSVELQMRTSQLLEFKANV